MAKKRGERSGEGPFPEPDMLPLMNIILMLILALITMAAMLPLGFLSSEAQKLARPGAFVEKAEEKKPLNLIVFITDAGFNVSIRGEVKMGGADPKNPGKKLPLIPKVEVKPGEFEYDYLALQKKLADFKGLDKEEDAMTITADPDVKFDAVIQSMDASRFDEHKNILFPRVSFAAGIVG